MQYLKWMLLSSAALCVVDGSPARAGAVDCADAGSFPNAPPAYAADFESGDDGMGFFGETSLWHRTDACAVTLPSNPSQFAMYFGQSDTCDYDVGGPVSGNLNTGFLNLRGISPPMSLAFRYFIETDGGSPSSDRLIVSVSNTQMSRAVIGNSSATSPAMCDPSGEWLIAVVDISDFAGFPMVNVSFSFDTVNAENNDFAGLYIDDIRIYGQRHDADQNGNGEISLSELLRVVQFFNAGGLHCAADPGNSEDGFMAGRNEASEGCAHHASDYTPPDWQISLSEVLRLVQFFNSGGLEPCATGEDGYCPVL